MYQKMNLTESQDFIEILDQMDVIYGEQDHIPLSVLEKVSQIYPDLFQGIYAHGVLVGHLIILPFNERGMAKITDLENDESNFDLDDFALVKDRSTSVYFFVYSIYGKNHRVSFKLIQGLLGSMRSYVGQLSPDSIMFAECVSEDGVRISEKLGLRKYYSYTFREEELHLYKAKITEFIKTGLLFKSLNESSFADPSYQKEKNEDSKSRINTPFLIESPSTCTHWNTNI